MANNFFEQLSNMGESLDRTIEVLGVPYVCYLNTSDAADEKKGLNSSGPTCALKKITPYLNFYTSAYYS